MKIPTILDVKMFLPFLIRSGFPALVIQKNPPIKIASTKIGKAILKIRKLIMLSANIQRWQILHCEQGTSRIIQFSICLFN